MSAPSAISFETRVESLRRILITTGWEFSIWNDSTDDEPRIRDTDAAERLGYAEPRQVRELIKRIWPENKRPIQRPTVGRTSMPKGGIREVQVNEYWLTEAQLLKLCARSETPVAESILDEMIAVFIAVRRHLLTTVQVSAHGRSRPARRAELTSGITPSERVMEFARRVAPQCNTTPEELLAVPLEAWADEMERYFRSAGAQPFLRNHLERYLVVPCHDSTLDALSHGVRNLGGKPTYAQLAEAAKRVLLGHAMIVGELAPRNRT